jgi:hypothetical protein
VISGTAFFFQDGKASTMDCAGPPLSGRTVLSRRDYLVHFHLAEPVPKQDGQHAGDPNHQAHGSDQWQIIRNPPEQQGCQAHW